jgi:hypothetical protein
VFDRLHGKVDVQLRPAQVVGTRLLDGQDLPD